MSSLKLMLGMIPATSKLEREENKLVAEYEKLTAYAGSEELARYYKLNEEVNNPSFSQRKKEIEALTYKGSEEYSREKEFYHLKKSKGISGFFKTAASTELEKFIEIEKSDLVSDYYNLEKLVSSAAFREKQKMKKKLFKSTTEYQKLQEFNNLKKNKDIIFYLNFKDSKEYKNYLNIKDSSTLKRYHELEAYLKSGEFLTKKEYLCDKHRFDKTDMCKDLLEYKALSSSENIGWYFSIKDSKKFDLLKKRALTFRDEFEGEKPDGQKWITNYYWGEKLLHGRYSIDSDLQAYTPSENFEMRSSILRIVTKPQKISGRSWHAEKGFMNKEFSYSSGLISTGVSFRQKYGIFEAKIRLNSASVRNAFWLSGEKITPHIDICRSGKNKVWFDHFISSDKVKNSSIGSRYLSDFYIYRLEWTPECLVWKINGTEVMRQTGDIPNEEMYLSFAGGVEQKFEGTAAMDIDWVRVYQYKK